MNAIRQCLSQLVQPARFCLVAPPTKLRASSRVPLLQHSCRPAAQHQLTARALHLSREAGLGNQQPVIFQTSKSRSELKSVESVRMGHRKKILPKFAHRLEKN
jgi:hypothetical protein